jgi:hypothetical protein
LLTGHKIRLLLAGFAVLWEQDALLNPKSKKSQRFRGETGRLKLFRLHHFTALLWHF